MKSMMPILILLISFSGFAKEADDLRLNKIWKCQMSTPSRFDSEPVSYFVFKKLKNGLFVNGKKVKRVDNRILSPKNKLQFEINKNLGLIYVDDHEERSECLKENIQSNDARILALFADFGLENATLIFPEKEVRKQEMNPKNVIRFVNAMRQALASHLFDARHTESFMNLYEERILDVEYRDAGKRSYFDSEWDTKVDSKPNAEGLRGLNNRVIKYLNTPESVFSIMDLSINVEGGETQQDNWILLFIAEHFSDHFHWAIVDRSGKKGVYNYGFN